jgi:hypothetical protein
MSETPTPGEVANVVSVHKINPLPMMPSAIADLRHCEARFSDKIGRGRLIDITKPSVAIEPRQDYACRVE